VQRFEPAWLLMPDCSAGALWRSLVRSAIAFRCEAFGPAVQEVLLVETVLAG
jgi:hypothetical protein